MTRHLTFVCVACGLITGCARDTSSSLTDAEWEAQEERVRRQMDNFDRQARRVDESHATAEKQDKRFDKLLDKWEEQSNRMDAILDKMESDHGLKK